MDANVVKWLVSGAFALHGAGMVGYWQGAEWWRLWAWVGSATTLAAVGLWISSVPFGVYAGGLLALGTVGYLLLAS